MDQYVAKIVRLTRRDGIYVQSKKDYCISNNIEKLGALKKLHEIEKFKTVGVIMVDLGPQVVFFPAFGEIVKRASA